MFTVLIAEKEHIDAIRHENKLFFEPFLGNKEIALCYWNPEGQNLLDAVPGLVDAVGRRKDWRAVIINNCREDFLGMRNPFDIVDNSAAECLTVPSSQPDDNETLEEWERKWEEYYKELTYAKETIYKNALEQPFQKLATWLCFRPEHYVHRDVMEKQDVHDWAMEMIGRDEIKPSVRLELFERDQYKCELRMKENIRKEFIGKDTLKIAFPSEVYGISLRSAENNYFDPDAYWTIHQDSEYSAFADRNMYFDRMRFLVFDILEKSHRDFRTDYIRFLATVMIFVSNPIPGSAMQARRLYQLCAETNDNPLCTMVTSYDRKLAATFEVIENEMEKIRSEIPGEFTDKAAEALFCTPQDVTVALDESCDTNKAFVEKNYGLFFDIPEDEYDKWNRNYRTSEKELSYIVKQQSRSVRRGVIHAQASSEVHDVNISRLTPMQMDDIREYTDSAEDDMVASIPKDPADFSVYAQRLSSDAEKVRKTVRRRMTRKTVIILSAIFMLIYICCFIPFIIANSMESRTIVTTAFLCIAILVAMAVIMFVSLFILRRSVTKAVSNYNDTVGDVINDIQASMRSFSKYLSAFCNVRRGHAVQNYARKNLDEYTKSLRIRKKHQEDIRKLRAQLAEGYKDYFGDRSFCDATMSSPYEYDFDETTEYEYPAPFLAGDCRQIEFISNGNFVTVPSSYVIRISVRMEGIYEK